LKTAVSSLGNKLKAAQARLGPLWWHSSVMFVVQRFGDAINILIGIFLVPAFVQQDQLGAILPLINLVAFVALPLQVVLATSLKYVNLFQLRSEAGKVKRLLKDVFAIVAVLSVIMSIYLLAARGFIERRLVIDDPLVMWLVGAVAIVGCWVPVVNMAAQGLKRFYHIIACSVLAPAARLAVILLVLRQFQISGFLMGTLAAHLMVIVFLSSALRKYLSKDIESRDYAAERREIVRFGMFVAIGLAVTTLQFTVEPWVVRQRLSPMDSAGYYIAAVFGMVPRYLAAAMIPFFFALVSERHERGESTARMHGQVLGLVAVAGSAVALILAAAGPWLLELRPAWRPYSAYAPFMWRMGLVAVSDALQNFHMLHSNACRRFRYLWYYVPLMLLECGMLYGLMGWPFFRPFLPEMLWGAVNGFIVRDLAFVTGVMLVFRGLIATGIAFETLRLYSGRGSIDHSDRD
jgi:hypothetical protein